MLHAKAGRFLSDPNNPGHKARLTLYYTDPDVVYFDSIPIKKSGMTTLSTFIDEWESRFGKEAPNAGFVFYHDVHNMYSEISVTISEPRLDPVNRTLNFQLEAIGDSFQYDLVEMDEVTLFIDEVKE